MSGLSSKTTFGKRRVTRISATEIAKMSRLTNKPIAWFFGVEKKMEPGEYLWKAEADHRHSKIPIRIAALVTFMRQNQDK